MQRDELERAYAFLVRSKPETAVALFNLGLLCYDLGKFRESAAALESALQKGLSEPLRAKEHHVERARAAASR